MNEPFRKTCINCTSITHSPFKIPCNACLKVLGSAPGWKPDRMDIRKIKEEQEEARSLKQEI